MSAWETSVGGWKTWKSATDPQQNRDVGKPVFRLARDSDEDAGYAEGSGMPENASEASPVAEIVVDACGLQCPGPHRSLEGIRGPGAAPCGASS